MKFQSLFRLKGVSAWILILCLFTAPMLQSCYTVNIRSVGAVPEPDTNDGDDYFRDKKFHVIKTKATFNPTQKIFEVRDTLCPDGCQGYASVQYKVSFGMALLNFITFGSVRKANVKIVCVKEDN